MRAFRRDPLQLLEEGNQECEEKIKEETGADIRVIPFDKEDNSGKCVYCNEQSKSIPIFARGY